MKPLAKHLLRPIRPIIILKLPKKVLKQKPTKDNTTFVKMHDALIIINLIVQ